MALASLPLATTAQGATALVPETISPGAPFTISVTGMTPSSVGKVSLSPKANLGGNCCGIAIDTEIPLGADGAGSASFVWPAHYLRCSGGSNCSSVPWKDQERAIVSVSDPAWSFFAFAETTVVLSPPQAAPPVSPAPPDPASTEVAATASCAKFGLVGVRGSGEPSGFGKPVDAFRANLRQRIGDYGAKFSEYAVPYPAVKINPWAASPTIRPNGRLSIVYRDSVAEGVASLSAHLADVAGRCPTRFLLVGYSQGAHVIGNLLASSRLPSSIRGKLVGVIFFSDPRFNPDDDEIDLHGSFSRKFDGILSGRPRGDIRRRTSTYRVASYCRARDRVCQGLQGAIPNSFVTNKAHVQYHGTYAVGAAEAAAAWLRAER
ncbi:cutinase family protein [Svornostia abyssi]|uniref:Cutinase family protein n=1 Tax=Svornostia abyssi TaxID=2898438 RepID=A0ABY5PLC9_9ACTN|nr:cutinase family protein [Parviterribacteraceae bacterium J379]